jgi:hypothetical protein
MDRETRLANPLSDEELTAEVLRLARSERAAKAALVAHLAEFEVRGLHLAAGFPSLFMYCTEVLRLSEHEAYNRIEVARLGRRFPRVLVLVGQGALNLTTARLLAPHLTNENHDRLLGEASCKSKREVEEVIARYAPRPDVPSSVRKVPTPPMVRVVQPALSAPSEVVDKPMTACAVTSDAAGVVPTPALAPAKGEIVRPLAPDRYEIRFTATAQTCEKLRVAKDLLRHAVPDGDIAEVVDRALTVFLEELARRKFAATPKPRPEQQSNGRHIPAAVKRTVWRRDGGRCASVGKADRRCEARGFLEFHHVRPYGVGGLATTDNIQIRCRAHNDYEADLFYGTMESEAQGIAIGESRARSGTS